MKKTYILGISALYHNSAAALICNGEIVAAAEEERFSRIKADSAIPVNAAAFCLDTAGITADELDCIVFYDDPAVKFERIITTAFLNSPKSIIQFMAAVPSWVSDKLWVEKKIKKELHIKKVPVKYLSHHLSHAASAFYPSPFEDAAIITLDGVGEWDTASWGIGEKNKIELKGRMRFPNSLGLLYSAFTYYTGFKINNGEYKMMGLAPYGKPVYADKIKKELVSIGEDGSIILNQKYFSYTYSVKTINKKFEALFGRPARKKGEEIDEFYADIAASIQSVTNEILLKTAKYVREKTGKNRLVMAGGVALNVTSTGLLRRSGIFDDIWIQPAAGDSGCAVGAAMEVWFGEYDSERKCTGEDRMKNAFLGTAIKNESRADDEELRKLGAVWTPLGNAEASKTAAKLVSEGCIVGVAREKAEFGPRALGHRSILADARDPDNLQRLNMSIKFREGFRPFAPAVIEEDAGEYFEMTGTSPYMIFSFPVKESRRMNAERGKNVTETASLVRSDIPSVTHIDYSARAQTVNKKTNEFFYSVLTEFKALTGYSVMINTSFNTNEEPIVNTAAEAYRCFMRSGIDFAIIGNRLFDKSKQTAKAPDGGGW